MAKHLNIQTLRNRKCRLKGRISYETSFLVFFSFLVLFFSSKREFQLFGLFTSSRCKFWGQEPLLHTNFQFPRRWLIFSMLITAIIESGFSPPPPPGPKISPRYLYEIYCKVPRYLRLSGCIFILRSYSLLIFNLIAQKSETTSIVT